VNDELATAVARLASVLTEENAALAARDLVQAGAMLGAKTRAVEAFLAAAAAGPRHGCDGVAGLARLADDNRRLLREAIAVQGRVIAIVARALPRALAAPQYGAHGRARSTRLPPVAVSSRA
jgi:hypothetical protein